MPTILVPSTVMVEMVYVQHSQRVENVFHVKVPAGAPTLTDLLNIRNVFMDWYQAAAGGNLRSQQSSTVSLALVRCASLHAVGAPVHEYVPNPPVGGALGGAYFGYVTLAVKWGTGLGGRSYRGRTYHVGLTAGIDAAGLISAANAAAIQTAYNLLPTKLTAAGYTLVVASKYSGVQMVNGYRRGIPRPVGITTPITSCSVERGTDTNRHRKLPHNV